MINKKHYLRGLSSRTVPLTLRKICSSDSESKIQTRYGKYSEKYLLVSKIIRIFTVVFFRIVVLECLIWQNEIQKERTFGLKTLSPPIATSTCASSRKRMKKSCLLPNCLPTISRSARRLTMRQTRLWQRYSAYWGLR